jgi:hypothetical protein
MLYAFSLTAALISAISLLFMEERATWAILITRIQNFIGPACSDCDFLSRILAREANVIAWKTAARGYQPPFMHFGVDAELALRK